uniref:Methyltransferase type 12 n=1 Tax=Streptomyces auratus AGR0001 TaxID=1160718 RepID=J2K265_9ACTN
MRRRTGPDDWREANRARWDEGVALHTASDYYDQDRSRRVRDVLRDFGIAEVGDVTGRSLLDLQCHFGKPRRAAAVRPSPGG